jgi:hypothetical protein
VELISGQGKNEHSLCPTRLPRSYLSLVPVLFPYPPVVTSVLAFVLSTDVLPLRSEFGIGVEAEEVYSLDRTVGGR